MAFSSSALYCPSSLLRSYLSLSLSLMAAPSCSSNSLSCYSPLQMVVLLLPNSSRKVSLSRLASASCSSIILVFCTSIISCLFLAASSLPTLSHSSSAFCRYRLSFSARHLSSSSASSNPLRRWTSSWAYLSSICIWRVCRISFST